MKKILALVLALMTCFSLIACETTDLSTQSSKPSSTESVALTSAVPSDVEASASPAALENATAGVCWYNFADTFISQARQTLEGAAAESGWLSLTSADSAFDIPTQTNNINLYLTKGVDYLLVNNFDATATSDLVKKAKEAGVTIIFLNCNSPSDEDFASYDNVWFISSLADQSGDIMGDYAAKYWKSHPEADRNGNGMMDYVMFIGIESHYDSIARRDHSISTVEAAGIKTNKVYENTMQSVLTSSADDIEAVFAANDDMALGAIEAMKGAGWFDEDGPVIPVVSVDATAVGVEALKEGTLCGTALNNPVTLGNLAYRLMYCLQSGIEVNEKNLAYDASYHVDGHRIWIDYIPIDASNIEDASY